MNINHFRSKGRVTQLISLITLLLTAVCGISTNYFGTATINEINTLNSNPSIETLTIPHIQPGWPQKTSGAVDSSPVLGDLDNDGELEVIIGSSDMKIYAWNPDGTLVEGWPVDTDYMIRDSPALGDIDGDRDNEVIAGSMDGQVYAWHHNGTLVNGWPIKVFKWIPRGSFHYGRTSSPALGDIDNDGIREIVIGTYEGLIYIWNGDGTPLDGWPQKAGEGVMSSPALGDLDDDGQLEIVIGSHVGPVYTWHHNGTPMIGWPQRDAKSGTHSSPALGDINGDGILEIIIGSKDYNVYAWYLNGTLVSGWPQQTQNINELVNATLPGVLSCPALADIDGDGDIEIVVGSSDFHVYAWHHTGDLVHGWPIATSAPVISSPALNDIDGDSYIEIVIGSWDRNVYIWEVESPFDLRKVPWSMFRANPSHTGVFQDFDGDGLKDIDELERYYTDPFVADFGVDTDQDGLQNVAEVDNFRTDPRIADTDGDGLKDGEELFQYKTNPIEPDTDEDKLSDGDEVISYKTNPIANDTDSDGLSDYEEVVIYGTSPTSIDTDGDGISDLKEIKMGSDPLFPELVPEFQNLVLMLLICTLELILFRRRQISVYP